MENPSQVPPNKLKLLLLVFAVFVVFVGGGIAIWSVTRKEDDESAITESLNEGSDKPPVGGRPNLTDFYTEEELQHSALVNNDLPDRTPEYQAVLINSDEGKRLVEDRMEKIQLNPYDADKLRAKHLVGKNLENIQSLSPAANAAIVDMFALVKGVTKGDYLTYPVYGRFETKGSALRADIDNFLSKDGQGYNLTIKRHGGNHWWFGSVGLNLMYGSKDAYVHSAGHIWWAHIEGEKGRKGLDFYKLVNGHNVSDRRLLELQLDGKKVHDILQTTLQGVTGIFAAWGVVDFVKEWKKAMDTFDKVTRQEAITALEREGLIRRL